MMEGLMGTCIILLTYAVMSIVTFIWLLLMLHDFRKDKEMYKERSNAYWKTIMELQKER